MTPEPAPAAGDDLHKIAAYSLVAGLCVLIPVPILDDWARDLMRKRQALELARRRGVELSDVDGKALACGYRPASPQGCAVGCLRSAVVTPIRFVVLGIFRKVVRKVLFFLTLKDVADTVSQTLHEGWLVHHALTLGALDGVTATATRTPAGPVLDVRRAIETACAEVDPRPIGKLATATVRGSRRIVRRAGRSISRLLRSSSGRRDETVISERLASRGQAELGRLVDELAADLERQAPYLRRLEAALERHLGPEKPLEHQC